jgi:hypothetical protein
MAWIQHKEWSALTSALVASFSTIFKSKLLTPLHPNPKPLTYSGTWPFTADPHIQAWGCITLASLLHGIFGESHGCTCSNSMTNWGSFTQIPSTTVWRYISASLLLWAPWKPWDKTKGKKRQDIPHQLQIEWIWNKWMPQTSESVRSQSCFGTQMATARNHSLLWWGSCFNFQSRAASNKINQCTSLRGKKKT